MRRRRLSCDPDGGVEYAASDLSLLAREVRRREHLTRSTSHARLAPLQPTKAVPAKAAQSAAVAPAERLDEVQPDVPEVVSPHDNASSPQLHGRGRSAAKERKQSRHGSKDTRRQKRRNNSEKNDSSNHRPQPAKNYEKHVVCDDLALDPGVETAMLRVFSGDGRNRGVSVSAIRRLYRKRHEEEKARAVEEVRRWWRVGRSEAVPLAEATVAASLLLASRDGDTPNSSDGVTGVGLAEDGRVLRKGDHPNLANDASDGVSFSAADGPHESPLRRENCDREQARYCTIDDLDCGQFLQDPLYAASVVRDVKQALRAGESVKIRSRQEPSLERWNSADSQLMLRTLYMQCVRVSVEGWECRQSM